MEMETVAGHDLASAVADVMIVGVHKGQLTTAAAAINEACDGALQRLMDAGEFKPDVGKALPLYYLNGIHAPVVLLIGLGSVQDWNRGSAFTAGGPAGRWLSEKARDIVAIAADDAWPEEIQQSMLTGVIVGTSDAGLYKSNQRGAKVGKLQWIASGDLATGRVLGQSMNLTRRLVNEPPSVLYPESFAERILELRDGSLIDIDVWDEAQLESERCGALLAVARGSVRAPRLVIMRYAGGSSDDPWLGLVGKGVTFDSGGLSLKPSGSMLAMKCDMAGAATVVGAIHAIAHLALPVNVMGIVGLVENMPSARAYKLGDVLTARNGRTIEVHNTDAEGRLVLADALSVAVDHGAHKLVDLATLTGACVVALGNNVAGVMTNDQNWCDQLLTAANRCGERVWQLPMFAEYGDQIKGTVADIKNVGDGRQGGAITAAKLLEQFVDQRPWTHVDLAGPAYADKPKPWIDAGGTGAMVPTIVELARGFG